MALIQCPGCGREISDRAKNCPGCGLPVIHEPVEAEKRLLCEECGTVIPTGMDTCPKCGCPVEAAEGMEQAPQKVEVTAVNLPGMKRQTKKNVFIAVAAVLALVAALLIGNGIKQKNAEKEAAQLSAQYEDDLEVAAYTMLLGAIEAEDAGNLIKKVWYNSIYEERDSETDKFTRPNGYFLDDFNDALSNLFMDSGFRSTVASIESNQKTVAELMRKLKNPPAEHEEAYGALKELYDAYTALTNLATNPTGSLTTFSENFNRADSEVANCYDAMELYMD